MAIAKFPEACGCSRITLPQAVINTPGSGMDPTPAATATAEPSGIKTALDCRMH